MTDPLFVAYYTKVRAWFEAHPEEEGKPIEQFDRLRRDLRPPLAEDEAFRRALWAVADELVGWY